MLDAGDAGDGLSPGSSVSGRYRIERELGRGGMATVYLARDLPHDRLVALKTLHPELAGALGTDRFLREISIASRLQHPNILPLFDSGSTDLGGGEARSFYVMPYVSGESLRARLQRETQLGLDEAIRICGQVAAALDHAHAQGIVHRDIKPENILLEGERAVVADFGLATALDAAGAEKLTQTGISLGTPAYMSPEQATARRVDARSDVYSLACVVYEMLVGDPPFLGSSPRAVIARHALDPVPSVRTARPEVPDRLEAALRRGLAKVPGDRFASAGELAAAVSGSGPALEAWAWGSSGRVFQAILHDQAEPLRKRVGDPPESLEPIMDRDARYGGAAKILTDLAKANVADLSGAGTLPLAEGPAPAVALPPSPAPMASRRRRLARLALGLLVLGAIGGVGAAIRSSRSAPAVSGSPTVIAVLPFSYRGSPQFSHLAEGMVDLLSMKLDGAAGLHSVDPRALLTFTSRDSSTADPQRGRLVAEHFGASRFVLGSIVEAGGRMQVSATVYDARARPQSSVAATAESEAGVFEVADRLARHLLVEAQDSSFDMRVSEQATSSLPALRAYLEGEREFRAGRGEEALSAFRRATELDTSFALAFYRLALGLDRPQALEALDRALRHSDRLAEYQRWLVEGWAAIFRGDYRTADQRFRQAVTVRPDLAEAWLMLAEVTGGKGHLLGHPWVDAREAFERALALDPQNPVTLHDLAAIAAAEGRRAEFDSLSERVLRLNPPSLDTYGIRGMRAVIRGDTAELARFIAGLRARADLGAWVNASEVTRVTGDLSAGRRLLRLLTEPSRSRGFRVGAHVTLAKIELTNGRRRAAGAELEAVKALDAGSALEHRAYFALTRFQEAPRSELMALRDSLEHWDAVAAMKSLKAEGDGLLAEHRRAHPYFKLYLLGLLSARLGDEAAAHRYAGQLERGDRSSLPGAFAADGGQFVRAEVAWTRGRPQEALTTLENARFWTTEPRSEAQTDDSPFYSHLHERFARAELLHELGRDEEAIPWYRVFAYDLLYTAPAHLRLAQIYERRGERQKAIEHYTRFVELWKDCDPELQPMVQQARDALMRLR